MRRNCPFRALPISSAFSNLSTASANFLCASSASSRSFCALARSRTDSSISSQHAKVFHVRFSVFQALATDQCMPIP